MMNDRLKPFHDLLASHRSTSHPLFPVVVGQVEARQLSALVYRVFAANLAVRTMLTLPEIHASCMQAALDLDPVRTAFGVMTGAEEGGFGRPSEVHTKLMMEALNNHGRVVYGLPPLDLKRLMATIRLLFVANQLAVFAKLLGIPGNDTSNTLRQWGVFDFEANLELIRRLAKQSGYANGVESPQVFNELSALREYASSVLANETILPATIEYCMQQLAMLSDPRPGYIQGIGFAHEGLADGMIFNIFKIMYAGRDQYESESQFVDLIYAYFNAHGDYLSILRGAEDKRDGVEAVHAQREFEKLGELDDESLATALQGANDFADRNARIWDALLECLQQVPEQTGYEACDNTGQGERSLISAAF